MADWEPAFRALLASRGGALRSYAYLLTGDASTAGDLYYEDLTVTQIADELGCAEGTVKRHLADARAKLATQLGVTEESTQ